MASVPLAANAAPTTPPMSACEELDGSPKYHVTRFQVIAPISPAKITVVVDELGVDDAAGHGGGDLDRDERADEVQDRRQADGGLRRERAGRDDVATAFAVS